MTTQAGVTQALALNSNWLDTDTAGRVQWGNNTIGTGQANYQTGWYYGGYCYPYLITTYPATEKIKLKLSEVERLREAAAADESGVIRNALKKFTAHIEIEVDF